MLRRPVHLRPADFPGVSEIGPFCTRFTEREMIDDHFPAVPDHLATARTDYFALGGAREIKLTERDFHFLNPE